MKKKALRGVSFTLEDGDFCTVIGSNGAGKSTTLNAIAGAFPIDSGSILIDGVDVPECPSTSALPSSAASFRIRCAARPQA